MAGRDGANSGSFYVNLHNKVRPILSVFIIDKENGRDVYTTQDS